MRYLLLFLILFSIKPILSAQNIDTLYRNKNYINLRNYPNSKMPINDSLTLKCKILRIKKVDKAYIIDIKDNNKEKHEGYYTIISLKSKKQNLKKIKHGGVYDFVLLSYYPIDFYIVGDMEYMRGTIYTINEIPITFKNDFKTGCIVTTPNLQGLYYIPNPANNVVKSK